MSGVVYYSFVCVMSFDLCVHVLFFFFKQKTAYEMRISDWSSDVCSSDLRPGRARPRSWPRSARRSLWPRALSDPCRSLALGRAEGPRDALEQDLGALAGGVEGDGEGGAEAHGVREIGRASCRERVCQCV